MKNYSQPVISWLASYHINEIKFWEENYYFKEQNINTRMSYLFQELLLFFYQLTKQACCLREQLKATCVATDWLSSPINRSALGKKHQGMRLSGHASLLSFQTRREQTVLIQQEAGKAVARVRKNIQAKGWCVCSPNLKYRKIRMSCQKRCFI